MAIIPILSHPNTRLHQKARRVENISLPPVQTMIKDMFETLDNTANCAGLAATQLDFVDPYAITVLMDYSEDKSQPCCLINPEIISTEGEQYEVEGCMSVWPDYCSAPVKRYETITVKALDPSGQPILYTAHGYVAKLIQHEVDHLNGMLYIQRLSPLKRSRIEEKIKKIRAKIAKK